MLCFFSALLFFGCAHKSVPPSHLSSSDPVPSHSSQIILASAEPIPLKVSLKDNSSEDSIYEFDQFDDEFGEEIVQMPDPLEPLNRAFFHFNDKFYFWLMKPVATGYKAVVPQTVRVGVKNFFYNLAFPIRFVNCLLQAKFQGAGTELARFSVNSTVGLAGFLDVAEQDLGIDEREEDFGQTLGVYGLGPGIYIFWPLLGPSSLTDTVGLVGDAFVDPLYYLSETKYTIGAKAYDLTNSFSLDLGEDYKDLKRMVDPYVAWRDAYYQTRRKKIKE